MSSHSGVSRVEGKRDLPRPSVVTDRYKNGVCLAGSVNRDGLLTCYFIHVYLTSPHDIPPFPQYPCVNYLLGQLPCCP